MKKMIAALCAGAVLTGGVESAVAHDKVFKTEVAITHAESTSNGGFHFVAAGDLSSPNERCLGGRAVKLIYGIGSKRRVKDVDTSSRNGAWAVKATTASVPDAIALRVTRKRLSSRPAHRHVCGSVRHEVTGPG
jgi:hypothetical protein